MPLFKTITVDQDTKVLIWKVEEPYEWLAKGIELTDHCRKRVEGMKSEIHRRGFMSIRHLMAEAGYDDHDLYYDELGKPHLKDEHYISITHSFNFTAIIISKHDVGIDIEKQRDKIMKIANKFTPLDEYHTLANEEALIRKLTIVWGAKESVYKLYAQPGLAFLQHINVTDFDFDDAETTAKVTFKGQESWYHINFLEFEDFTCVYAQPLKVNFN
ncbi:4'-phosphopantetheinyl transferase family protein [Christiangramia flava]|uniref:Siderophore (Surfactin) biosynthesis regulatory protein n=1 Tax=Christiangramia flava JLT2011 TaxID=1229726 RepID=A0A1L7I423_9FLAO|nr:4'-phosphopantetheinyl transferase family protein [Christiangramia flava]APU67885.1 Siderophore (Surfactin) biosynthesis regulatory protein [Christiangramia flava JLT2011]OSS40387.1 siderophore (surfactin) biosynthesis regulatory protein [Christiangramia flava JLT2011]